MPLTATDRQDGPEAERPNVVRIVDFLGPISPELVLVDPGLAPRARALLPEFPASALSRPPQREPARTHAPAPARFRRPWSHPRLLAVAGIAVAGVVAAGAWKLEHGPGRADRSASRSPTAVPRPPVTRTTATRAPVAKSAPAHTGRIASVASPHFVWPPSPGAVGYRMALYRAGRKIFEEDVKAAGLTMPGAWTYDGRLQRLTRGTYRWVVWPRLASGGTFGLGQPIVSARYVV